MIHDNLSNIKTYSKCIPFFDEILDFLKSSDVKNLKDGKHTISGDDLFVISNHYNTDINGPLKGNLEVHRKYIDLQIIISGEEKIRYSNLSLLNSNDSYDSEKDVEFLKPQFDISEIYFSRDQFAIFFPEDAHEPGCAIIDEIPVHKLVFKIHVKNMDTLIKSTIW